MGSNIYWVQEDVSSWHTNIIGVYVCGVWGLDSGEFSQD